MTVPQIQKILTRIDEYRSRAGLPPHMLSDFVEMIEESDPKATQKAKAGVASKINFYVSGKNGMEIVEAIRELKLHKGEEGMMISNMTPDQVVESGRVRARERLIKEMSERVEDAKITIGAKEEILFSSKEDIEQSDKQAPSRSI